MPITPKEITILIKSSKISKSSIDCFAEFKKDWGKIRPILIIVCFLVCAVFYESVSTVEIKKMEHNCKLITRQLIHKSLFLKELHFFIVLVMFLRLSLLYSWNK